MICHLLHMLSSFLTHCLNHLSFFHVIPSLLIRPIFSFHSIIILSLFQILLLFHPHPLSSLHHLSASLLFANLIVSCCCSLLSFSVFHLPFPLPNTSLYSSKTKDRDGKMMCGCVCVHFHNTPPHSSFFKRDNWKEVFPKMGYPPLFKYLPSKQTDE